MGQRFTEEQLEQMIMQLEQGGLLQAPPSLERGVMEKIARLEEENQADIRFSSKTKRIFYQLKIGAAMAASLVLLALPMGHGSYEESPYGTGGRRKGKPAGLYAAGNENPQRWCDGLFRFRNETYYGGI